MTTTESERPKGGRKKRLSTKEETTRLLKRWRAPGAEGFFNFLDDVKPRIPSEKGGYQPYTIPNERVRAEIEKALSGGYSTLVFSWPRRHGKTVVSALIIMWRFLTRRTENVAVVANSQTQSVDTAFRTLKAAILETPYTRRMVDAGAIKVGVDTITYPSLDNKIQGFPSSSAALYGKKLSIAQVSELHAARTDTVYQTLASSTIDTTEGLVLIDSTVGPKSSPLFTLYQLARDGEDETICFSHIEYRDLDDAIANCPNWIDPKKLKSRARQMLPIDFAIQHLNSWQASSNDLFPPHVLERCKEPYDFDSETIAEGRTYHVAAGLDRAMLFSQHGDATVLTAVMIAANPDDDEPHVYILESRKLEVSTEHAIKSAISDFRRKWNMNRIAFETYQAQDLHHWAIANDYEAELVTPTAGQQQVAFANLAHAAIDGRLHIHPVFADLLSEMSTFQVEIVPGSQSGVTSKFGHAKGCKDDHVYSLSLAYYALRQEVMHPYAVAGVACDAPGAVAELCVLNGGQHTPHCSETCRSFRELSDLYNAYRGKLKRDKPMPLDQFFSSKVRNIGSHSMRR